MTNVDEIMTAVKGWFIVSIAAWTAFAVLITAWSDVARLFEGRRPEMVSDFGVTLVQMYTLGLLTPLLIYVAHVFPPTRRPSIAPVGAYIASVLVACAVGMPLFVLVSNLFLGKHFTIVNALEEGIFDCLTYAVVLTIVVAVTQIRVANERTARALRLEADLTKLRVEALQRQLHPHFIFNTLNAVVAIMQTDVVAAEEMIDALASLLRTATDKSNRPMVPLREELTLVDRYALIMKMRYGDRLQVRISTEPRALEVPVPTFTLQPLVENAIVHGLEKTRSGITIDVSCRLEDDTVRIDVSDDGTAPDISTMREGVGIGNTRARLAELYGSRAVLSIAPRESLGTRLTLAIPVAGPAL
ncbi:MAG: histidine kinase [Candidatus Eremiobacteraeota bacterium]|nr:histidine kinase [Candidatus Eremiobacteraeota bacterium]